MAKIISLDQKQWTQRQLRELARRDKLVKAHLGLVTKIAAKVQKGMTHIQLEDLEAAGYVGLIEAAARYRKDKGSFEHFAYFRIRGSMYDAHKRRAYRDDTMESIDGVKGHYGFLPAYLDRDDKSTPPDEQSIQREQIRLLEEAVKELEDADQRLIIIRTLQGQPLTETARECGKSIAWARAKLAGARQRLGARVMTWGIGLDIGTDRAA